MQNEEISTSIKSDKLLEKPIPFLTILITLICIIDFLFKLSYGEINLWSQYESLGFYPYEQIIAGKYWALITSAFVHGNLMHIAFNCLAIVFLGKKIEKEIGFIKYGLLFLTSCIASSGLELLFENTTGMGISGVAYAFVGFLWIAGKKLENFKNYLRKEDFNNAIIWMVACFIMTYFKLWNIANFSHLGGFLWGVTFAYAYMLKEKILISLFLQIIQLSSGFLAIFYAPWNTTWLKIKASEIIKNGDYEQAKNYLNKIVANEPNEFNSYYILASISESNKDYKSAEHYYKKLIELIGTEKNSKVSKAILSDILYKTKSKLALMYLLQSKPNEAIKLFESFLTIGSEVEKGINYYNLACAYALINNKSKALENLSKAGGINKNFLKDAKTDNDFNNIKDSDDFLKLTDY